MDTLSTTIKLETLTTTTIPPPPFINSISEFRSISTALTTFLQHYDDLNNHIKFVNSSLDQHLLSHLGHTSKFNDFSLTPLVIISNDNVLEGFGKPNENVTDCVRPNDDDVLEGSGKVEEIGSGCERSDDALEGSVSRRNSRSDCCGDDDVLEGSGKVEEIGSGCERSDDALEGSVLRRNSRSDCCGDDDVLEGSVWRGNVRGDGDDDDNVRMHVDVSRDVVLECGSVGECEWRSENVRMNVEGKSVLGRDVDGNISDCEGSEYSDDEIDRDGDDVLDGSVSGRKSDSKCVWNDDDDDDDVESDCDVLEVTVTEGKDDGNESDCEQRGEDVTMRLENDDESDCDDNVNDVNKIESDCERSPDHSENDEEVDVAEVVVTEQSNDRTESRCEWSREDVLKKCEETDCDDIMTDVRKDVVLEQEADGTENECEGSDENVRMDESVNDLKNCKETDLLKSEEAYYDRLIAELLEDIARIEQESNETASKCDWKYENVRKPGSADSLMNSEVTEEPGEADASKNIEEIDDPEETDALKDSEGSDYDRIITDLLEDVVIEQKSKGTASNPDVSQKPVECDVPENPIATDSLKNPKPAVSELERLCKSMGGREMKKYIVKNISEMDKIRIELPKALKLAVNPARVVLDSIGTYFLQSGKPYYRGSNQNLKDQIEGRRASVLILECFVMISDGVKISREDEVNALETAVMWKNRVNREGGMRHMEEADASGLLLFISGFGISDCVFSILDIMDLIRASNLKGTSTALRRSVILIRKIPEVIDMMVMRNLVTEAADIAYILGLEDKYHPKGTISNRARSYNNVTMLQSPNTSKNRPAGIDVSVKPDKICISKNPDETEVFKTPKESEILKNPEEADTANEPEETNGSKKPEKVEILKNPKPAVSELERLCKNMGGRELKKYIVKNISYKNKLRIELPKALKLAVNPAKVVLDSIGMYYLQSPYHRGPHHNTNDQIEGREASVLILECFVMISSDCVEISKEDETCAAEAAVHWKNRGIREGGLRYMEEADARGLLLFISGFGISDRIFSIVDLMDLIRASNVKEISTALRRSVNLILKIPDAIDMLVTNCREIEAVDITYTFGLEDKCHPETILTNFLHKKIIHIPKGSFQVSAAIKKQLHLLKTIKNCLESHNVDPSELLLDFKINEKIQHLEKELNGQNSIQKRKSTETESLENPNQETKRTCFSHQTVQNDMSPCNRPTQLSSSYFGQNSPYNYIPSSVFNASALPVDLTSSVGIGLAGPSGTGVYYGGNSWPYGCYGDPSLVEKYLGQPYLRQSQTYYSQPPLTGLYGRPPDRYNFVDTAHMSGLPGFPRSSLSGGFAARRGPVSDLYSFADVVEKESRAVGTAGMRPV